MPGPEDNWDDAATLCSEPEEGIPEEQLQEVVAWVKWLQYHRLHSQTSADHQLDPQTNAIRILLRGHTVPSILITTDQVVNNDGIVDTSRSTDEIISERSTPAATISLDGRGIPINSVLYMLGLKAGRHGEELDPNDAAQAALAPAHHTLRGRMMTADVAAQRGVTLTTQAAIPGDERMCPRYTTPGSGAATLSLSYQPEGSSRNTYINACTREDFRSLDDNQKIFWDNLHWLGGIRLQAPPAKTKSLGSLLSAMFSRCLGRRME